MISGIVLGFELILSLIRSFHRSGEWVFAGWSCGRDCWGDLLESAGLFWYRDRSLYRDSIENLALLVSRKRGIVQRVVKFEYFLVFGLHFLVLLLLFGIREAFGRIFCLFGTLLKGCVHWESCLGFWRRESLLWDGCFPFFECKISLTRICSQCFISCF